MVENTNMSKSVVKYLSDNFKEKYLGEIQKSVKAQYSSYESRALVFDKNNTLGSEYSQLAEKINSIVLKKCVTVTQNN